MELRVDRAAPAEPGGGLGLLARHTFVYECVTRAGRYTFGLRMCIASQHICGHPGPAGLVALC